MLILMTSPAALLREGRPDPNLVEVLIRVKASHCPVGVISNHPEPPWFAGAFKGSGVQFLQVGGRQTGGIVKVNANKFSLEPHNVIVLVGSATDVQMGKNGGAVLVGARWTDSKEACELGIGVDDAVQLQEVLELIAAWPGQWWFSGDMPLYRIRALADLSTYGKSLTQVAFAGKLTAAVKQGGSQLQALLAITARSLLQEGLADIKDLFWGVYPSSSSANNDSEILSDFAHRLRTTVSRVRFAKPGEPLFIRHTATPKRSAGGSRNRRDPLDQVTSLHLNPTYQQQLQGRHVVVLDDCTTYGVSFGVAAAFLRRAGATAVTSVALGKFGDQLGYYDLRLKTDPFRPVPKNMVEVTPLGTFAGTTNPAVQASLRSLVP